jgi:hypothetical protein
MKVTVTDFKLETAYEEDVIVQLTLVRHPENQLRPSSARANDVPQDFVDALLSWLSDRVDIPKAYRAKFKREIEALVPNAVPAHYFGAGHDQPMPALRLEDIMEIVNE